MENIKKNSREKKSELRAILTILSDSCYMIMEDEDQTSESRKYFIEKEIDYSLIEMQKLGIYFHVQVIA